MPKLICLYTRLFLSMLINIATSKNKFNKRFRVNWTIDHITRKDHIHKYTRVGNYWNHAKRSHGHAIIGRFDCAMCAFDIEHASVVRRPRLMHLICFIRVFSVCVNFSCCISFVRCSVWSCVVDTLRSTWQSINEISCFLYVAIIMHALVSL